MKKALIMATILILAFAGSACSVKKQASLPPHLILQKKATVPENVSGLCGAYILAVDTAINLTSDNVLKKAPEFISFNFTTTFPLHKEERDLLVKQFDIYGIPIDTRGFNPPERTMEEMLKGFVIEFPTGGQHQSPDADLTITVNVNNANKGHAYYFDYVLQNKKYILYSYTDAFEKVNV